MTKDELEAAIKLANLWAGRSTLVLAVGILGEYVLLPFLEKKRWAKPAKAFFAVLVVAGIVGEYEFSSHIAQYADELQRGSDRELASAMITAGNAVKEASKAAERASANEKEVARANEREANAERRAAELNREVVKFITPRRLTPEQSKKIAKSLRAFPGTRYELEVYPDTESATFAEILDAILSDPNGAGWNRRSVIPEGRVPLPMTGRLIRNIFTPFELVDGVQLIVGTGQYDTMTALYDSLSHEGVTIGFASWLPVKQQESMLIVVGRKMDAYEFLMGRGKPPDKGGKKSLSVNVK